MKKAIIRLKNGSLISVKTLSTFDIKCENVYYRFLEENKNFANVDLLLDNMSFPAHAEAQIYPYFGAKIIEESEVDGRSSCIKKLPYFTVRQLVV